MSYNARRARLRVAALAALSVVGAALVQVSAQSPAAASPPSGVPDAVVSLGDSIASGEGGRWIGTRAPETDPGLSRDRGVASYLNGSWYDMSTYPATEHGCHASNSAPLFGILPAAEHINLGCSGAQTINVRRHANGGQSFKGQAPQADKLVDVAKSRRVRAVVLTIGANDLGFAPTIAACADAYVWGHGSCAAAQDWAMRLNVGTAMDNIGLAIEDVKSAMAEAGYAPSDYRLIVQDYPVLVAAGSVRSRTGNTDGCPFYSADMDWMVGTAGPRLAGAIRQAVRDHGGQFLDVRGAFLGHELCRQGTTITDSATGVVPRAQAEWANWVRVLPPPANSGAFDEQFHPNFYGQLALQDCLGKMFNQASTGNFTCNNIAGPGGVNLDLAPLGDIWTGSFAPASVLKGWSAASAWGTQIPRGTCVDASNGLGHLCLQTDGNLVLKNQSGTVKWQTGAKGSDVDAWFQRDGNLVLYKPGGVAVWDSGSWGNPDAELVLRGDNKVVIQNAAGTVFWVKSALTTPPPGGGGGGCGSC